MEYPTVAELGDSRLIVTQDLPPRPTYNRLDPFETKDENKHLFRLMM
jgi:hypothetical protein